MQQDLYLKVSKKNLIVLSYFYFILFISYLGHSSDLPQLVCNCRQSCDIRGQSTNILIPLVRRLITNYLVNLKLKIKKWHIESGKGKFTLTKPTTGYYFKLKSLKLKTGVFL